MAISSIVLSLVFFLAAPAQEAAAPNADDSCVIRGVVIKAGTGEPLHKATVEAHPADGKRVNDQAQGGFAETDAMGRFELSGLAPGQYYLSAVRNGYVRQQYGQRTPEGAGAVVTLSAGQKLPDITFQMIPAAVIYGHVLDEDGEPVVYAQVMAMHYVYVNGQRQLGGSMSGQTNDLGEFRIFGLSPGQYFVQAMVRSSRPENARSKQGYVPVYYPGVSDAAHAAPITLRGGDEFSGVEISLQPVRTLVVRGNVINSGCGTTTQGAMVFLREQNPALNASGQYTIRPANAQGVFEFPSVTPGAYYLYAMLNEEGRQCFGRQTLEVGDADVDSVTVAVTPGVEIKGRVQVDGQSESNVGSLFVSLSPKTPFMPFGSARSDPTKADGSFSLKNASDGDYELNVGNLPDYCFVKSARLDGVDVLAAGVTVDTKQAPGSLDIVISANGAYVDGVVSKDEQTVQGATVAIVPDPPHRGDRRLYKSTTTDQNGHFTLQGLAPGDYKVFAWEKVEPGAYTSSDFLQPYENLGEAVHITEGSRNTVQLDLIPAKDANQ